MLEKLKKYRWVCALVVSIVTSVAVFWWTEPDLRTVSEVFDFGQSFAWVPWVIGSAVTVGAIVIIWRWWKRRRSLKPAATPVTETAAKTGAKTEVKKARLFWNRLTIILLTGTAGLSVLVSWIKSAKNSVSGAIPEWSFAWVPWVIGSAVTVGALVLILRWWKRRRSLKPAATPATDATLKTEAKAEVKEAKKSEEGGGIIAGIFTFVLAVTSIVVVLGAFWLLRDEIEVIHEWLSPTLATLAVLGIWLLVLSGVALVVKKNKGIATPGLVIVWIGLVVFGGYITVLAFAHPSGSFWKGAYDCMLGSAITCTPEKIGEGPTIEYGAGEKWRVEKFELKNGNLPFSVLPGVTARFDPTNFYFDPARPKNAYSAEARFTFKAKMKGGEVRDGALGILIAEECILDSSKTIKECGGGGLAIRHGESDLVVGYAYGTLVGGRLVYRLKIPRGDEQASIGEIVLVQRN